MRTYNQQRREFVLLAMKLIEREPSLFHLTISDGDPMLYKLMIRYGIFRNCDLKQNEFAIKKLRDLLRSE